MRYLGLVFLLFGLFFAITALPGWAWDGDWTHAKSGRAWDIFDDPDNSQGKGGTDPPQNFWIPGPLDYADIDPEYLRDNFDRKNRHYTPYALARIEANLHYNGLTIPKGYYLIKPGDELTDGSTNMNLRNLDTYGPVPADPSTPQTASQSLPPLETEVEEEEPTPKPVSSSTTQTPTATPEQLALDSDIPVYKVFVLLKSGKVVGVVPVHRMQKYQRQKKEKLPRQAVAWVEFEERRPVLKFYYKKWVYETEFQ